MQLEEFKGKISKESLIDKITFYTMSVFALCGGTFILYDALVNPVKYNRYGTRGFALAATMILISFGVRGFYLVSNRYKIIKIESLLSISKKKDIISELINNMGNPYFEFANDAYKIDYKRKWYTTDYTIYINLDEYNFYLSIQNKIHANSGFADFGGTERLRKTIQDQIVQKNIKY